MNFYKVKNIPHLMVHLKSTYHQVSHCLFHHCLRLFQIGCQIYPNCFQTFDVDGKHIILQPLKPYPLSLIENHIYPIFLPQWRFACFLGLINASLSAFLGPNSDALTAFLGLINAQCQNMISPGLHLRNATRLAI